MIKRFHCLVVLALSIYLSGCVTYEGARKSFVKQIPQSNAAYMAGKFTVHCKPNSKNTECFQPFDSMSVFYMNNQEPIHIDRLNFSTRSFNSSTKHDTIDYEVREKGFYFCRILPAEPYSLHGIQYVDFNGPQRGSSNASQVQFKVPIELIAGKISIIDNLKLTVMETEGLAGGTYYLPGVLKITELTEDEVQLAIDKCPQEVRNSEVLPLFLWKNSYDTPLVVTE